MTKEALPKTCWVKIKGQWHKGTVEGRKLVPGFDVLEWAIKEFPNEVFSLDDRNISFDTVCPSQTQSNVVPEGPGKPTAPRELLLRESIALTCGDRDAIYGPPEVNLACAGELKAVFRKWTQQAGVNILPGEQEALDQIMTKLARRATGTIKRDTYADGAAYWAIAWELSGKPK